MPTYGPWRDDAVPTWQMCNLGSTSSHTSTYWFIEARVFSGGYAAAAAHIWSGTEDGDPDTAPLAGPITGVATPGIGFQGTMPAVSGLADWTQVWTQITRGETEVTSGTVPPGSMDPDAIGVEWEPTTTIYDQRLTLQLGTSSLSPRAVAEQPVTFKRRDSGTSFLTRDDVLALDTLVTITPPTATTRSFVTFTPPVPLSGGTLNIFPVDYRTLSGTPPASNERQFLSYNWLWEGLYAPRYRFVYADAEPPLEEPVRRLWPRSDGRGLSDAPRIWPPPPSIYDDSNRIVGGYPDD